MDAHVGHGCPSPGMRIHFLFLKCFSFSEKENRAARDGAGNIVAGLTTQTEKADCMAKAYPTGSNPASQTAGLAERLLQHAKTIRNPAAAAAMGDDMREAARVIEDWRVGIRECIESTKDDDTRARLAKLVEG